MDDGKDAAGMSDGLEAVRAAMAAEEPVELPPDLVPPAGSGEGGGGSGMPPDLPPGPPDSGAEPPPPEPPGDPRDIEECSRLPLNDLGNARRFLRHFGEKLLYVRGLGWHVWDERRWAHDAEIGRDTSPAVRRLAHLMQPLIEAEVAHLQPTPRERALIAEERQLMRREAELNAMPEPLGETEAAERAGIGNRLRGIDAQLKAHKTRIGRHLTHAKNIGNSGPISNMVGEARAIMAIDHEAMDAEPLDVNCENGVLRFEVLPPDRDGGKMARVTLLPHDPALRMTKLMPASWQHDAQAPVFEAFLERIQPDPAMRDFLARWFGLCLTALTGEQKLVYFYGGGGNGKSVLVDLVARVLGSYAATAKIETLTGTARKAGSDATPDLVPLIGARMARASEPDEGTRWQEGLIKQLTGGEPIMVRPNFGEFIEALPLFKLLVQGNHKPVITGTDDGIWRRLLLVPFDVQIPAEERDPNLLAKLWAERDGVLAWMVHGLIDYLEGGLQEPARVLAATAEFREESDPMGQFLTTACVVTGDPSDAMLATALRDAFQFWQMQQGGAVWRDATVSRRLGDKEQRWTAPNGRRFVRRASNGDKYYDGIRLTDTFRRQIDGAERNKDGRPVPGARRWTDMS